METYVLKAKDGKPYAFEIENVYIGPKKIAELLQKSEDVTDVKLRKAFSSSSDIHVEFKFQEKEFMVWESFGDSSRYWIGPKDEKDEVDISDLESEFLEYEVPPIRKVIGDLFSLKFRSLFNFK